MIDEAYLDPEFNPQTLTIPQLKSILSEAGVQLPMKQNKKQFYVDLFHEEITLKLSPLLKKKKNVKANGDGIVAVSKRGSPLPNNSVQKEKEIEAVQGSFKKPLKRRTSSRFAVKKEVYDEEEVEKELEALEKSFTTNENPFQSAKKSKEPKTEDFSFQSSKKEKGKEKEIKDEDLTPKPTTLKKFSPLNKMVSNSPGFPIAGIGLSFNILGYIDPRQVFEKNKKSHQETLKKYVRNFLFIILTIFTILLSMYLQQYRSLPYCPANSQTTSDWSLFGIPYPLPHCLSCPPHAVCYQNSIKCENGYLLEEPFFPLHKKCVPDTQKYAVVEEMIGRVKRIVNRYRGEVQCGEVVGEEYLTEDHVRQEKYLGQERFDDYWQLLMKDLQKNQVQHDLLVSIKGGYTVLFYGQKPHLSSLCRLSKLLYWFFDAFKHWFLLFGLLTALVIIAYRQYQTRMRHKKMIQELVEGVTSVLVDQEKRFREGIEERSALSITQVRDFFLSHLKNAKQRAEIWKEVRREILGNSSVRETILMIEGEQHDAWQWIGSSVFLSPFVKGKGLKEKQMMYTPSTPMSKYPSYHPTPTTSAHKEEGQHQQYESLYPKF